MDLLASTLTHTDLTSFSHCGSLTLVRSRPGLPRTRHSHDGWHAQIEKCNQRLHAVIRPGVCVDEAFEQARARERFQQWLERGDTDDVCAFVLLFLV